MNIINSIPNKIQKFRDGIWDTPHGRRLLLAIAGILAFSNDIWAQSAGAGGFASAATEIKSYQQPVSNLMKAIAAVIVLVGAFNVYFKMQNGDQDVKKTIMLTVGGCVAFIAMSEALPLFFD